MTQGPLVSVIVPTYYRNEQLAGALRSATNQTYEPVELIVVDDSGEGHAGTMVEEFDVDQYIEFEENKGPNNARTAGIEAASGKFVQLLDDDDRLHKDKLFEQMAVFERHPEAAVVYTGGRYESGEKFLPASHGYGDVLQSALQFDLPGCITSTMLINRECLMEILPLPTPPGSDDTYLKIELAQQGSFEFVPAPLVEKGQAAYSRAESRGAVKGTWDVLTQYAELYDRHPPEVRQRAMAAAAFREAEYLVSEKSISLSAIQLTYWAWQTAPRWNNRYLWLFFLLLFGQPGLRLRSLSSTGS